MKNYEKFASIFIEKILKIDFNLELQNVAASSFILMKYLICLTVFILRFVIVPPFDSELCIHVAYVYVTVYGFISILSKGSQS